MPQNKPSRDESCLSRCNTWSMVGSADPRNMAALTQFISSAMRIFGRGYGVCVFCCCFFSILKPWKITNQPWAADSTIDEILHRGRLDSSRLGLFWGFFFFPFGESPSIFKIHRFVFAFHLLFLYCQWQTYWSLSNVSNLSNLKTGKRTDKKSFCQE